MTAATAVRCPKCHRTGSIPPGANPSKVRCPGCKQIFAPAEEEEIIPLPAESTPAPLIAVPKPVPEPWYFPVVAGMGWLLVVIGSLAAARAIYLILFLVDKYPHSGYEIGEVAARSIIPIVGGWIVGPCLWLALDVARTIRSAHSSGASGSA